MLVPSEDCADNLRAICSPFIRHHLTFQVQHLAQQGFLHLAQPRNYEVAKIIVVAPNRVVEHIILA